MSRAMMSVDPPAAKPTNIFTGPFGQLCAEACIALAKIKAAAVSPSHFERVIDASLTFLGCKLVHRLVGCLPGAKRAECGR
jgi:hypothetical protein